MKSKTNKVISTFVKLLIALVAVVSVVFAWMTYDRTINNAGFGTGRLTAKLELSCWDKHNAAWIDIKTTDNAAVISPDLGQIDDLASLPADSNVYFKAKVMPEQTGASSEYTVYASDITIKAGSSMTNEFKEFINQSGDALYPVNYYLYNCFKYSYAVSTSAVNSRAALDALFDGAEALIDSKNQTLTGGEFVDEADYLYIKIEPVIGAVQAMAMHIPSELMPYTFVFSLKIAGEVKTTDG